MKNENNGREKQFDMLYRECGIDGDTQFLKKLYNSYIKNGIDKNVYEWIDGGAKSNFSNYKKGKKGFPENYVLAIELYTGRSLADILGLTDRDDEERPEFIPRGIRYAAYMDREELYSELAEERNEYEGDRVLLCCDDYGKNIFDYIIEYNAHVGVRYLVENMALGFRNRYIQCGVHGYNSSDTVAGIWRILLEMDDPELFRKATKDAVCRMYDTYTMKSSDIVLDVIRDDSARSTMIEQLVGAKKVYESLFHPETVKYEEREMRMMNPMLKTVFEHYLNSDERICNEILDAYEKNLYLEIESLKSTLSKKEKHALGFVADTLCYGINDEPLMIIWELDEKRSAIDSVNSRLMALSRESILGQISDKTIEDMLDGEFKIDFENRIYYEKCARNTALEMLEQMSKHKVCGVPEYYGENHGVYSYEYPVTRKGGVGYSVNILERVLEIFAEIQKASRDTLGEGRTYLHGSGIKSSLYLQSSESYATRLLVADWSKCTVGDAISDILTAIMELTDITSSRERSNSSILEAIIGGVSRFSDKCITDSFGDKLYREIEDRLAVASKEKHGALSEFEELYEVKCFVDMYRDELNSVG